jgi:ABC-type transport system involved in cytochrome c biogenesis permease subunit
MLLAIHLSCAIVADLLAIGAGALAFTYLIQDRFLKSKRIHGANYLPPLRRLDSWGLWFSALAFAFMSVGIVAGIWLAQKSWGDNWYTDPRQWWSALAWSVFGLVLMLRVRSGFRGRKAAWITIIGTFIVLSGALLLNWFEWSRHKHPTTIAVERAS